MFKNLRQIFNPKNKDIKKRIWFTLIALLIFEVGNTITIPGTNVIQGDLGFLEYANALTGGGLKNFSIFGLGVMPYISASILLMFLQNDLFPYFKDLKDQGDVGRQKINKITRYIGIILSFAQGFALAISFLGKGLGTMEYLRVALIMCAGTAFLLWLGDRITQKGLGNGISLIIMAGIISAIPKMFTDTYTAFIIDGSSLFLGILSYALFIILYLGVVIGIIFIQESERRVPIQYANQTTSAYGARQTYIPFKLNPSGVMPVIFASTLLSLVSFIANVIKNNGFILFVQKYLTYTTNIGFIVYVLLIFIFSYVYTLSFQIKPEELSKNLGKDGGYIPGIRPGKETTTYITKVVSRLTLVGALFIVIIAGLPIIFTRISSLPNSVHIGGTGLLIVVGVALESFRQLESSLVNRNYKRGR